MGEEHIDTRLLAELTEQSQDLNSDALKITSGALSEFAEAVEERGRWWRRSGVPAGAAAAALAGSSRAAAAAVADDIMALQTAASIENLAVTVYRTASGLPIIRNGNKTIAAFITKTGQQHQAHAQAFNAAAARAGGKPQKEPDPTYAALVKRALPAIRTPADVVRLVMSLEDAAAQTYTKNVGQVSDPKLRRLFASVAPVEAQHRATLLAVRSLLSSGDENLIAAPTNAARLPAAIGSVEIPDAFYPTTNASPISEGTVK